MSEVKLLDIEEIEHEVFTRWDITGADDMRHDTEQNKREFLPSDARRGMASINWWAIVAGRNGTAAAAELNICMRIAEVIKT
jgi:hypothetical protein